MQKSRFWVTGFIVVTNRHKCHRMHFENRMAHEYVQQRRSPTGHYGHDAEDDLGYAHGKKSLLAECSRKCVKSS